LEPFDPKLVSELSVRAKQQLRQRARALRRAHSAVVLGERSARIVERVQALPAFQNAGKIALFWPLLERGEVDLRTLDEKARAQGKAIYYPFVERTGQRARTGFRLTHSCTELEVRGERFAEPPETAEEAKRGDIDLVIVPALAVAGTGHRLGYGMGFYDATLPDVCPPARALVVAYGFELLAELPTEPHDFACELVVTDERSLEVGTSSG
jgi:5-formyltetrahydrofolate cyclo-ligase